jgi:hypothetical protein
MKALALPMALLMTLGSSVGATLIRADRTSADDSKKLESVTSSPTQAQIAAWKATASTTDYTPPAPPR